MEDAKRNIRDQLQDLLKHLPQSDKSYFLRIYAPINKIDSIQWLKQQDIDIKTYWRDREGKFEMAGLGEADVISGSLMPDYHALFLRLNEYLQNTTEKIRYYGGMRFNKRHNSDFKWQAFTSYRFIIPKFEIFRDKSGTSFICNLLYRPGENFSRIINSTLDQLEKIKFSEKYIEHHFPQNFERSDFPEKTNWSKNIELALSAFNKSEMDKIVLARKTTIKFDEWLDPVELLWRIRLNNHRAYYFYFQPVSDVAFLGGTPEQLYYRHKNHIHTEAVAGTRRRGNNSQEDYRLEKDLLTCEKDIREHRFVVDSIRNVLDKICIKIKEQKKISILKLSRLQHLLMQFSGQLNENIHDSDILENIHPTPAVGGVPSKKAIEEIENIEQFDRGWYAGPVGWIGKNEAEFAVAIRSGLVYDNELFLFSGAGIVEGSDYESEWDEIENKIAGFMDAIIEKMDSIPTFKLPA